MEQVSEKVIEECAELELRVRKLENYWYVTIAVAVILGFGGAYIGNSLRDAQDQIEGVRTFLANAERENRSALAEMAAAESRGLEKFSEAVDVAIKDFHDGPFQAWMDNERVERERRDSNISKWVRNIYVSASETGLPGHEGANGWWQKSLIDSTNDVQRELPR